MEENLPEKQQQTIEEIDEKAVEPVVANTTETSKSIPHRPETLKKTDIDKSGPGWIVWSLTFLFALTGTGISVYLWHSGDNRLQQLQGNVAQAVKRVDEQSTITDKTQREMDRYNGIVHQQQQQAQQQIGNLKKQIDSLAQRLESQKKRLQSLTRTDRNDWLLAEAEYLMRLANQRLLMGKEISGAKVLLKTADDIIRDLDDHALYPVRQALAQEIGALHSASSFDLEGVYLQLEAVAVQADQLRLLAQLQLDTQLPPEQPSDDWQQRLSSGIRAALEKLSNYVQIERRDDIYKPVLAPAYEDAVRQNVRLMFEQAQMALLAGNQSFYTKSLGKAKDLLSMYYTLDKQATAIVITTIEQLEQQKVTVTLPDISGSLRALKNYIETLHFINTKKAAELNEDTPIKSETPGRQL